MKKYLLIDMSNILYRAFFANVKEDKDIVIPLCHHSALMSLRALDNKFKSDELVAIFDSPSWRKNYTNGTSISHKKYKGNRRQNLTPSQQENFEVFDEHIGLFYEFLRDSSSIITIKRDYLECDDIVEAFITEHPDDQHTIVSSDKDFMQLLGRSNVTLVDPGTLKHRTLIEYDYDPDYFMFMKCFRGDTSDNVQSSYPRLTEKKIKDAYTDSFKFTNIMEHEFDVEFFDDNGVLQKRHYKTKELYEENKMLMDLTKQPDFIRRIAFKSVKDALANRGSFNIIKFIKFCNEHQLDRINQEKNSFSKLLMKHSD
jgi:5'-3' exonuclease